MGQTCSICGFKEEPQQEQATAHVETSLREIQASHQSQQPPSSSPLFNMTTNASSSDNAPFFLYTEGAIVPEGVTHLRVDHSVAAIPTRAFAHHHQLKEVVLPEGIQEIGVRAFRDCLALECINFPSPLTAIGFGAFAGCVSLTEVELDLSNRVTSTITTIGNWAFQRCTSLERIAIPSTLTAIGAGAFSHCTSLREVKLVGGIQRIGAGAFNRCSSLERIDIPTNAFVIETEAYHNCGLRLLTDRTITVTPTMNLGQVVLTSECLKYMSMTGLAEVSNRINAITNSRERTKEENLERMRALFAYYELVEVTTILELALWKARVDEFDDLNVREECRFTCGAGVIIKNVLPFL